MTIPVSVVILTKNEEMGIAQAIASVQTFAEVVIVDSSSTDRTAEIATRMGARVVSFAWNGQYPKKKQWSLDHAGLNHDWVLLLDADEYPGPELVAEIAELFAAGAPNNIGAYDLSLRYKFAGRFLRHGHKVTKRSLVNRHRTRFPLVDDLNAPGIREVEGHYQPQTTTRIERLRAPLYHDDVDPVSSWFERHNRYSDWEAHLRINRVARHHVAGNRSSQGALFDRLPLKPLLFFAYGYVAKAGFLDGRPGLDYHIALSTYYWQIGVKTRELQSRVDEVR